MSGGTPDEYIEVQISDIETANKIAGEVLGRSLDELPPQTRQLLMIIDRYVFESSQRLKIEKADFRFSRRAIREYCQWGNTQLKLHFSRLEELEYLLVFRGARGYTFDYELIYNGQGKDGRPFLMGLIDTAKLRAANKIYDAKWPGEKHRKSPPSRPQVGPESGGCRGDEIIPLAASEKPLEQLSEKIAEKSHIGVPFLNPPSHHSAMFDLSISYALLAAKEKEFEKAAPASVLQPITNHQPTATNHANGGNGDGRD
jgi:hypothetical protein